MFELVIPDHSQPGALRKLQSQMETLATRVRSCPPPFGRVPIMIRLIAERIEVDAQDQKTLRTFSIGVRRRVDEGGGLSDLWERTYLFEDDGTAMIRTRGAVMLDGLPWRDAAEKVIIDLREITEMIAFDLQNKREALSALLPLKTIKS